MTLHEKWTFISQIDKFTYPVLTISRVVAGLNPLHYLNFHTIKIKNKFFNEILIFLIRIFITAWSVAPQKGGIADRLIYAHTPQLHISTGKLYGP